MKYMDWKLGAVLLGLVSLAAFLLAKPIGVSTQYVLFDGVLINTILPEFVVNNAYFAKYAGKFDPTGYSLLFTFGLVLGGMVSMLTGGPKSTGLDASVPKTWQKRFGKSTSKRYIAAFVGGVLVLIGARLAGGCTSGHIISGVGQMAISGLVFAAAMFAAGVPVAHYLYERKGK